ncbi:MAG: transposase [Gammaproteobacteria bacterium]
MKLLKMDLVVPSYTQLSRRMKQLPIKLKDQVHGNIHVVLDESGLKVFGKEEWKVRQHGDSKHRIWRKLDIGLEVESQEIVMMQLTDNHIGENELFNRLLDQYKEGYDKIGGDKGYDSFACHEEVGRRYNKKF